ncbi:hypothetical protein G6L37_04050 [Agrobacterium rubi]|nr:hypothetical protein [Agrobacterium rubi]NTF24523.1 hypothetical protein [Agrobacterium rubi]
MKTTIADAIHGTLSSAGTAVNIALVGGFAWATARLWSLAEASFSKAGGVPPISAGHIHALASDPALSSIASSYVIAWFSVVGAVGCAFMTALGIRWGYHALLRASLRIRD